MSFSLRSKLFLLVGLAVAFTALPVIFFSREHITETSVAHEREAFANTLSLVEDGLSVRYLHLLTSEVAAVLDRKTDLRQYAELISKGMDISDEDWMEFFNLWRRVLAEQGYHIAVFGRQGEAVIKDRLIEQATAEGVLDFKGQPVRTMTIPELRRNSQEQFAVVRGADPLVDGDLPLLLFFMPVKEEWMLVLASPVADTESGRKLLEERMLLATQERLESLESTGASIAILNSKGEYLAGGSGGPALRSIPEDVLAKIRKGSHVEGMTKDGSSLYRLAYFKALDWYVMASIPMAAITGPAETLTRRLLIAAAVLLVVSLLLTLVLTVKILFPLRLLTEKTGKIAAADLSSGQEGLLLADTAKGLPVERKDEVGKLALSFVNMARALSENIRKLVETTAVSQRMQGELSAARDIQMGILPPPDSAPSGGSCAVAAFLQPAKEVGGDLYDFFTAPDGRQVVVIGDVSDKGVPAALFMSMTVTLVRYAIAEGLSCAEAMERINDRLAENNPSCMFVTLFIGLFDPATGVLEYASGAHCPPITVSADSGTPVRKLSETSGPLVGAMTGMDYAPCRAVLERGEYCLLYTDGISEAMNEAKELFGEDGIEHLLDGLRGADVKEVLRKVMEAVEKHRGAASQSDDITMLCFKRL